LGLAAVGIAAEREDGHRVCGEAKHPALGWLVIRTNGGKVGVDRIPNGTGAGVLAADDGEPPLRVRRVAELASRDLRVPTGDDQLETVRAAELEHAGPSHVELALHERDAELVRLGEGEERVGHLLRGLPLTLIGDREAGVPASRTDAGRNQREPAGRL